MIDRINTLSASWSGATWPSVWQGTLLAVVVALAACWVKGLSPSVRHWLWLALAIKLLIMPLWFVRLPARPPVPVAVVESTGPSSAQVRPELGGLKYADIRRWQHELAMTLLDENQAGSPLRSMGRIEPASWCLLIWSSGLAVVLLRLIRQGTALRHLLAGASALDDPLWQSAISDGARSLGLRKIPRALVTGRGCSPFVCGLRGPTLVIPSHLIGPLDSDAIRRVVLHELAHIRRGDLLWCWIPEVLALIQWFNPIAHWIAAQARLERELACDQLALAHTDSDPRRYAEVLVDILSRRPRAVLSTSDQRRMM